jgi:hypothetical protein
MPHVEAGNAKPTSQSRVPAWGCNCPSFRTGKPGDEKLIAAVARATGVTVAFLGIKNGVWQFECFTVEGTSYQVVFDPQSTEEGGWCKHTVACAKHVVGDWLGTVYQAIAEQHPEYMKGKRNARKETALQDECYTIFLPQYGSDGDGGIPLPPL